MNDRLRDWSSRTSRRETRVQCTGRTHVGRLCGAHRILELTERCFVCGSFGYERVPAGPADIPAILADLTMLVGDLLEADDSPETHTLISALAASTLQHQRSLPVREVPSV